MNAVSSLERYCWIWNISDTVVCLASEILQLKAYHCPGSENWIDFITFHRVEFYAEPIFMGILGGKNLNKVEIDFTQ